MVEQLHAVRRHSRGQHDGPQPVRITQSGVTVGERAAIDFLAGIGILLQITDDPVNDKVSVTITDILAGAGGTGLPYAEKPVLTAKGSIYAATAPATPADVPVGLDGQVLTADSSQPAGVGWRDPDDLDAMELAAELAFEAGEREDLEWLT